MQVAMTGSTGLIGSALAARLEAGGHEVVAHPPRRRGRPRRRLGSGGRLDPPTARSPGTTRS